MWKVLIFTFLSAAGSFAVVVGEAVSVTVAYDLAATEDRSAARDGATSREAERKAAMTITDGVEALSCLVPNTNEEWWSKGLKCRRT